jgi:hypothetical protein
MSNDDRDKVLDYLKGFKPQKKFDKMYVGDILFLIDSGMEITFKGNILEGYDFNGCKFKIDLNEQASYDSTCDTSETFAKMVCNLITKLNPERKNLSKVRMELYTSEKITASDLLKKLRNCKSFSYNEDLTEVSINGETFKLNIL